MNAPCPAGQREALPLYRRMVRVCGPVVRGYSRLEVRGRENLPPTGGAILAANHPGSLWWDALCLAAGMAPRPIRFVGNAWDFRNRLTRGFLRRVGALAQTEPCEAITDDDPVVQAIRHGELVCHFPEEAYHTFWKRYTVYRFAPHTLHYALRAAALIVPTAIVGPEEAAATLLGPKLAGVPFHFPLIPPVVLPLKVIIEFGRPQTAGELMDNPKAAEKADKDNYETGCRRLQASVADLLAKHRTARTSDVRYLERSGWL